MGHKKLKSHENPHYEQIMKTFAEIVDTAGRNECKNDLYKVFVNTLFSFPEKKVFQRIVRIFARFALWQEFSCFSDYPY